jgi:hypothetical protein
MDIRHLPPFIILKYDRDKYPDLLTPLELTPTAGIYRINIPYLNSILGNDNYIPLSDIYVENNQFPRILVFADKQYIQYPVDYVESDVFGNGILWEPITDTGYKSLGIVYRHRDYKPKINNIGLLSMDYLRRIKNSPYYDMGSLNDYGSLSNSKYGFWDINFAKISNFTNNNILDISDRHSNYLVNQEDKLVLTKSISNDNIIKYSNTGDLYIDNKCIDIKNDELILTECNNIKDNIDKWMYIDTNIRKNNKCILSNSNKLTVSDCDPNNDDQKFYLIDKKLDNYYKIWDKYKGNTVMLIENPDPWFKNITEIPAYQKNNINQIKDSVNLIPIKKYADYESKIDLDINNKYNFGRGYSIASIPKIPEHFSKQNDSFKIFKIIAIIICVILLLLFCVKKIKKTTL